MFVSRHAKRRREQSAFEQEDEETMSFISSRNSKFVKKTCFQEVLAIVNGLSFLVAAIIQDNYFPERRFRNVNQHRDRQKALEFVRHFAAKA